MHGTAPAGNSWHPVDAVNAASLATLRSKGSHTDNSVPFNLVSNAVLSAADAAAEDQRGSKLTWLTAVAQTHAANAGYDWTSMPFGREQSSTHITNFAGQSAVSSAALQL